MANVQWHPECPARRDAAAQKPGDPSLPPPRQISLNFWATGRIDNRRFDNNLAWPSRLC
jgi:hypothetical protein